MPQILLNSLTLMFLLNSKLVINSFFTSLTVKIPVSSRKVFNIFSLSTPYLI